MSEIERQPQREEAENPNLIPLPEEFKEIIEDPTLSAEVKEKVVSIIMSVRRMSSFSGPLPSPESVAEYNRHIPNGADRIMSMAEQQQSHRMQIEKTAVTRQFNQSSTGQWMGFIIGIVVVLIAAYLGVNGERVLAGILGGGDLVALVAVFVLGKRESSKSLKEKEE
jgi:uncharacterized membrane protein